MPKKQDTFYFDNFVECAELACQAAEYLEKTVNEFQPEDMRKCLAEIHVIEHAADCKKHDLMQVLTKAFITPIEREDIMELSQQIDDLVDETEDVLIGMYCNNVLSIRPDAPSIVRLLCKTIAAVRDMLKEFANFRRSKKLRDNIIAINSLEEEADKHYVESLHELHSTSSDPIEIIVWRELYANLEHCFDVCEHIADTVESIVMKNS